MLEQYKKTWLYFYSDYSENVDDQDEEFYSQLKFHYATTKSCLGVKRFMTVMNFYFRNYNGN